MSNQTDIVYGYGWIVSISDDMLKQFILDHKDTVSKLRDGAEILSYVNNKPMDAFKEDWYDYEQLDSYDNGAYGIIADVMTLETGIRFAYLSPNQPDDTHDEIIMFNATFPWNLNEKEARLSEPELRAICKKYMLDCGDTSEPDYQRAEYWG